MTIDHLATFYFAKKPKATVAVRALQAHLQVPLAHTHKPFVTLPMCKQASSRSRSAFMCAQLTLLACAAYSAEAPGDCAFGAEPTRAVEMYSSLCSSDDRGHHLRCWQAPLDYCLCYLSVACCGHILPFDPTANVIFVNMCCMCIYSTDQAAFELSNRLPCATACMSDIPITTFSFAIASAKSH